MPRSSPGGGSWAQVELTDALIDMTIEEKYLEFATLIILTEST